MISPTMLPVFWRRVSGLVTDVLEKFLMLAGAVFIAGFFSLQAGNPVLADGLRAVLPGSALTPAPEDGAVAGADEVLEEAAAGDADQAELNPRLRAALDYVAKRYRVSTEALQPIFAAAQTAGREHRLDPLLIVAVIGVESRFNPFSQSVYGAQGLMQVVPRFHLDKLPDEAEPGAFLDPVTNVQVGARVLKESIRRYGSIEDGLQQFGGAVSDPDRRYSSKVLAEKQRLEQAAQRLRTT